MSAKVLLSTEHLYATHPGRPMVLTDVNVSFRAGVRVAILGANGSGKTTLMRCLSGSLKPAKATSRGATPLSATGAPNFVSTDEPSSLCCKTLTTSSLAQMSARMSPSAP